MSRSVASSNSEGALGVDETYYLNKYPHVRYLGVSAQEHFELYGKRLGYYGNNSDEQTLVIDKSASGEVSIPEPVHLIEVVENDAYRLAYWKLVKILAHHVAAHGKISHFIVLPFFANGGAEYVASCFASIASARPGGSVIMVAADRSFEHTTLKKMLPEVTYIDLPRIFVGSEHGQRETILFDLIRLCRPFVVHNINSEIMWRLIIKMKGRLGLYSRTFCSLFAFQYEVRTREKVGYAANFLMDALPYVDAVLSDNSRFVMDAIRDYNLDEQAGKLMTIYNPAPEMDEHIETFVEAHIKSLPSDVRSSERFQVLWAGRLDAEKRPELLVEVATLAPDIDFHVFGSRVVDSADLNFEQVANVFFHGPYSSAYDVTAGSRFHAFMFTSRWEGMPNALIEFGALGLPVIAPLVGGIRELIDNRSGYTVSANPSAESYLDRMRQIINDPEEAAIRVKNLVRKIKKRHSWAAFSNSVNAVCDYWQ